jgi:hypothetical protein
MVRRGSTKGGIAPLARGGAGPVTASLALADGGWRLSNGAQIRPGAATLSGFLGSVDFNRWSPTTYAAGV